MVVACKVPLTAADTLAILWELVSRATQLSLQGCAEALQATNEGLMEVILKLAEYHPNVKLPDDYTPPAFYVQQQYWCAWRVLLCLSACNTSTLGACGWRSYPTLRLLTEMATSRQYSLLWGQDGYLLSPDQEEEVQAVERREIVDYER